MAGGGMAACGGGGDSPAVPEGNWDVTLSFTDGDCDGLPDSFDINFDIDDDDAGGFIFTPGNDITGDDIDPDSNLQCFDDNTCDLHLIVTGPGDVLSNIDSQTISADLTLFNDDTVTGDGDVEFDLDDGSTCDQNFDADGDVI
jgi:hypothetical protein